MGRLSTEAKRQALAALTHIGRNAACLMQLEDSLVSQLHATLTWQDGAWELRDLGSTNGTFVNGRRLSARARLLVKGDRIGFGTSRCAWRFDDDAGPQLMAMHLASREIREENEGVLCLPDEENPVHIISAAGNGFIVSGTGTMDRLLDDQEMLIVGEQLWRVFLPGAYLRTRPVDDQTSSQAEPRLIFKVSPDEEHVDMLVLQGDQEVALASRADHYLLVTLARRRLTDMKAGVPREEAGWSDVDELCRALRMDEGHLNVQVHRARARLKKLDYLSTGGIIERRTRYMRIATENLTVIPAG